MSKANKSSRKEVIIEVFGGNTPRFVVEIDQDVPAEDHVELALWARLAGFNEIDPGKLHRLPEIVENEPSLIVELLEISGNEIRWQAHQRALPEDAGAGRPEHACIDVGAHDLDVEIVDLGPVLKQPNRNRIGLLAGRAWRRPYPYRVPGPLFLDALAQQVIGQAFELMILAVKIRLVDREGVDDVFDLVPDFAAQKGEICGKAVDRRRGHTLGNASFDVVSFRFGKHHSSPPI